MKLDLGNFQYSQISSFTSPTYLHTSKSTLTVPHFESKYTSNKKNHRTIKAKIEIRVCVNNTCRRQGSRETLETLSGISPADISVISCGCLGRCGAGPNLVVLPDGVFVGHCGTAARAAEVLFKFCGGGAEDADPSKSLEALALRKRAEEELEKGNFSEAELLLSQAIDLKPFGGLHVIYKIRSTARLGIGNKSGALEDAKEALSISPQYPQAFICQGDAFLALEKFDAAEESYSIALEIDPSIRRSKLFKYFVFHVQARVARLQEKITAANIAF